MPLPNPPDHQATNPTLAAPHILMSRASQLMINYKQSLTAKTMLTMAIRIALVVLIMSVISYIHLMSQLAEDTQEKLLGYISERGRREEQIFVLAEDNHTLLRNNFLKEFETNSTINWEKYFDQYFFQWTDGTVRNAPEGTIPKDFETEIYPSSFIGRGVKLDQDLQKRMVLSYQLVKKYGAGWQNRFLDTYISLPEGANTVLWPGAS